MRMRGRSGVQEGMGRRNDGVDIPNKAHPFYPKPDRRRGVCYRARGTGMYERGRRRNGILVAQLEQWWSLVVRYARQYPLWNGTLLRL